MTDHASAFARYVDAARQGRTEVWRILIGALLIGGVWTVVTLVAFVVPAVAFGLFAGGVDETADSGQIIQDFAASPVGIASMLASFIGIWIGVWLVVRTLHRRPLRTVLGADGRIAWRDFVCGFAATFVVSVISELVVLLVDPSLQRNAISLGAWFLWLAPLTVLLFVQISAEELAFRGYLLQSLAARFRNPLVWGVLPAVLFTLVHWDSTALPWMNAVILLTILAFAATATILVYATGNLGAAMGVHLGMNFFGILIVSHAGWLNGAALFVSRPLEAAGWTPGEATAIGLISVGTMPLALWLLLSSRSPLKVTETRLT